MIDYQKLRIDDIRRMIVEEGHLSQDSMDSLDVKGKSEWVKLHKSLNGIDENEEVESPRFSFEDADEKVDVKVVKHARTTPRYCDPEWQDYVLSQFTDKEMVTINDLRCPTVNGLRRVVELLLGEILWTGPVDWNIGLDTNGLGKASVIYEIAIAWKLDAGPYIDLSADKEAFPVKKFRAMAGSCQINTDDTFAVFPEAIAETRAEGRALRRALRLSIVCADELTRKDTARIVRTKVEQAEKPTEANWDESAPITENQINSIKLLCDRLGVDVVKFINSGSKQYKDIIDISKQTAASMLKRLNEYQNNVGVEVPSELLLEKK